jgi:hypothetical protein
MSDLALRDSGLETITTEHKTWSFVPSTLNDKLFMFSYFFAVVPYK